VSNERLFVVVALVVLLTAAAVLGGWKWRQPPRAAQPAHLVA
jgi:hypothetical protein